MCLQALLKHNVLFGGNNCCLSKIVNIWYSVSYYKTVSPCTKSFLNVSIHPSVPVQLTAHNAVQNHLTYFSFAFDIHTTATGREGNKGLTH